MRKTPPVCRFWKSTFAPPIDTPDILTFRFLETIGVPISANAAKDYLLWVRRIRQRGCIATESIFNQRTRALTFPPRGLAPRGFPVSKRTISCARRTISPAPFGSPRFSFARSSCNFSGSPVFLSNMYSSRFPAATSGPPHGTVFVESYPSGSASPANRLYHHNRTVRYNRVWQRRSPRRSPSPKSSAGSYIERFVRKFRRCCFICIYPRRVDWCRNVGRRKTRINIRGQCKRRLHAISDDRTWIVEKSLASPVFTEPKSARGVGNFWRQIEGSSFRCAGRCRGARRRRDDDDRITGLKPKA